MCPSRLRCFQLASNVFRNSSFVSHGITFVWMMRLSRATSPDSMSVASASAYCISDVP